jgi:hypothetical protein
MTTTSTPIKLASPTTLSTKMQHIARDYIAARERAGESLLAAARYLAEARAAAKHGEWGVFLEATNTSEGTAKRWLDIHEAAERDAKFADGLRSGRLAFTVAAELAQPSTPPALIEAALMADEPPTVAEVRAAKSAIVADLDEPAFKDAAQRFAVLGWRLERHGLWYRLRKPGGDVYATTEELAPQLATLATFEKQASAANPNISEHTPPADDSDAPFWQAVSPAHPTAHRWIQTGMYSYRSACGMTTQRAPSGSRDAGHCSSCDRVLAQRGAELELPAPSSLIVGQRADPNKPDPKEPPPATAEHEIVAVIREKAAALGLELVWEDDEVLLYWPDEIDDLDQMDGLSYELALEWLEGDALTAALRRARQAANALAHCACGKEATGRENIGGTIESRCDACAIRAERDDLIAQLGDQYKGIATDRGDALDGRTHRIAWTRGGGGDYAYRDVLELLAREPQRTRPSTDPIESARSFLDKARAALTHWDNSALPSRREYEAALDHINALLKLMSQVRAA